MEPPPLEYTLHANHALVKRRIPKDWVERVVAQPALRIPDPNDAELERFFGGIPEQGGRVLPVVVNTRLAPWRVVSVFFDQSRRGQL